MRKNNYDNEPVDSFLIKSREEVVDLLSTQIKAADTILKMDVQGQEVVDCGPWGGRGAYWTYDEGQKEVFYNAYHVWDEYNVELLTRAFKHPCNKCRSDYEAIGSVGFYSSHENIVEKSRKRIREKVAYLKGLISRLPLIPTVEDAKQIKDNETIVQRKVPKIFISHKTEDAKYANAIISMLITLGVKHEDIFCSSVEGYGVPFGKNIVDALHNQFDSFKLFVIFIHSPRYYKSAVSLNEMGAAWILRNKHCSFLTKDCTFPMLTGVIDSRETAFKAGQENTYPLLHDFRNDIMNFFSLDKIPDAVWETTKNEFVDKVTSLEYDETTESDLIASAQFESVVPQKLTSNEDIVIGYMKQVGKEVRISEISSDLRLSMSEITRILRKLVNDGAVISAGNVKYGKYKLA